MSNYDPNDIDYCDVLRYSGSHFNLSEISELLDDIKQEMFQLVNPKTIFREDDIIIKNGYYYIPASDLLLKSNDINKKFINVTKILTLAGTLGILIDEKISFYRQIDPVRALLLDTMSNVYIENILDKFEYELREKYSEYYFTMRYSCGYGDLALQMQSQVVASVRADELLGISVNKNFFMTPIKSVTAFIGLSNSQQIADKNPCLDCSLKGKCVKKCRRSY